MVEVVILGGGNIGDVKSRLDSAEALITERIGEVISRSEWHTTEPWGFAAEQSFTNRAYVVATTLSAEGVLEQLLEIEALCGRDRLKEYKEKIVSAQNYACRTIDLDILLYGEQLIVTPHLQIPHPHLLEREFALQPMCQALGWSREQAVDNVMKIIER